MAASIQTWGHVIHGEERQAAGGRTSASIDPASGTPWARVADGGEDDVAEAVESAARAFAGGPWPELTPTERGAILHRFGDLIRDRAEELAQLETRDNGKAIRQTRGELAILANWFWYYGGAADKIQGSYERLSGTLAAQVSYEPMGVVGALTPFNSPLLLAAWKLAPALAAGNTVVLKPSPETPISSLVLAKLGLESGLPPGVLNVVAGGDDAGRALVAHPDVRKISFTGASATGREVAATAAATMKSVSIEGGGKSPHIVFGDANLDQALIAVAGGVFISAGQTCVAGSRLFVEETIYDEFVGRLCEKADSLVVGNPTDPGTHVGALTSETQLKRVRHYAELAHGEGAEVLAGGASPDDPDLTAGYFFRPTVLGSVRNEMRVCQEEIFGPVVVCLPFRSEEEVIETANAVPFGLAGGVWTNDIRRAHRVADGLRAGTVWINNYRTIHWQAPFGGMKQSGYGRENGLEALRWFLEPKTTLIDTSTATKDPFAD